MSEIESIIKSLVDSNPVFSKGVLADKEHQGVDDYGANHFFVELDSDENGLSWIVEDQDDGSTLVRTRYTFIARFERLKYAEKTVLTLAGQLQKKGVGITAMGCDTKKIYESLYDKDYQGGFDLVRIDFELCDTLDGGCFECGNCLTIENC